MDEATKLIVGVAMAIAGLVGLFLAARGVDVGMQIFGLLLAAFAVFLDFWLIKRHFDQIDNAGQAPRRVEHRPAA
jgi:hypothetical protein